MSEIDGLCSDAWLSQLEKRARARRNRQLRMLGASIVVAFGLAVTILAVVRWWVMN